MIRTLEIADLFCGAGGTSTGAMDAARSLGFTPRLTAVNHWPTAVSTHTANHPGARHVCASVDSLNPRQLFAGRSLDILWASPECVHFSRARGSAPMNDQSRATGHCVTRWAEALAPGVILVENVKEFEEWGPLGSDGRPMKSKKGATFRAWVAMLESLGYRVDWRVLCAADYGDPTTRERLFVQAVRGRRRIVWPEPSHAKDVGSADLFDAKPKWRAAREIIDWDIPSQSIYARKRPLAENTLRRIRSGLERFCGPFLISMEHGGHLRSPDVPINTITTARGGAHALVEPFLVSLRGTDDGHIASSAKSLDSAIGAIAANGTHHALCEPCLLPQQSDGRLRPISEPAPTVAAAGAIALVEPFLVEYYGTATARSVNDPLGTATTKPRFGLAQPEVKVDGRRYRFDIRFRMLQPHELAAAQGFPKGYLFTGTKTEVVRQIGNAVPCGIARALVAAVLSHNDPRTAMPGNQAA